MVNHTESPVLIVGAGAAGLTAAATLAAARHRPPSSSNAGPSPRRSRGRRRSRPARWRSSAASASSRRSAPAATTSTGCCGGARRSRPTPTDRRSRSDCPRGQQGAVISPTSVRPAWRRTTSNPTLLAHLRTLGPAGVANGHRTGYRRKHGHDGVRAMVRDASTGLTRTVRARYLVAADGAHSRVRGRAGHPDARSGPRLREVVTALFRAPLWEVLGERRYGIYAVNHPRRSRAPSSRPARTTGGCSACSTSRGRMTWPSSRPRALWSS